MVRRGGARGTFSCARALLVLSIFSLGLETSRAALVLKNAIFNKNSAQSASPHTSAHIPNSSGDAFYQSVMQDIDEITRIAKNIDQHRSSRGDTSSCSTPETSSPPPPDSARLMMHVKCDSARLGDTVLLMGSGPDLGDWSPSKAIELVRGGDGMWCTDMQVQPNSALEFKLAIRRKGVSKDMRPEWENLPGGKNRRISMGAEGSESVVSSAFGSLDHLPLSLTAPAAAKPARAAAVAPAPLPVSAAAPAAGAGRVAAKAQTKGIATVHFRVKCDTRLGEEVMVVGGPSELGAWGGKGLLLSTNAESYPWWEASADLMVGSVGEVRYKYVVKGPSGERWEDAIADRTVSCDAKSGILGVGLQTFIDDGEFNMPNRACTYVRRGAPANGGMELVSADQIQQWRARTKELEEEVLCLKGRIATAKELGDEFDAKVERELEERGEMKVQLEVVQQVISRMRNLEAQVNELERAKAVMLQKADDIAAIKAAKAAKKIETEIAEAEKVRAAQASAALETPTLPRSNNGNSRSGGAPARMGAGEGAQQEVAPGPSIRVGNMPQRCASRIM